MNGRFSVIPGKDVTIENLGYYQLSNQADLTKLFRTQTSTQRVSLLFVVAALADADIISLP